jgi:hypothetical protein
LKKIILLSPHFPPSNLAAVHRARLFANHLPSFGWEPIILTVSEKYYEEPLDHNLVKLLPPSLRIEKVSAFPLTRPRLIGDIGLRAFFPLLFRIISLCRKEKIDFLYILIPSFYASLLGRIANWWVKIPYGIDYIDPWVHTFPGSEKILSRHWFSTRLAGLLEPFAVKKACLITGVAEGYYQGVLDRNPGLHASCRFVSMPYGGEASDHEMVKKLELAPGLFPPDKNRIDLIYAGALLPKAFGILEEICIALHNAGISEQLRFNFIGTGTRPGDPDAFAIKSLAEKYELWNNLMIEYPLRIPYLEVLTHLHSATAVFILGSTEPHYSPSKVFQAILSGKPILAVLHEQSTAVEIIRKTGTGLVLTFRDEKDLPVIRDRFADTLRQFILFAKSFQPIPNSYLEFDRYTARSITAVLARALDEIVVKD